MTGGHDLRLLLAACAAWACLALALAGHFTPAYLGAGAIAFAATGLTACMLRRPGALIAGLAMTVVACVLLFAAGHEWSAARGPIPALAGERASGSVEIVVTSEPARVQPGRFATGERYALSARVTTVTARGATSRVATPVTVLAGGEWKNVTWHSHLRAPVRILPSERLGPSRALLIARGAPRVIAPPGPVTQWSDGLRQEFRAATSQLPDDARGLVPALVAGDTAAIPADLTNDMKATGMSHLNAVSGSNTTIVLMAVLWCAGWARCGLWARLFVGAAALGAFVILCRPEPSVIRAAAMGVVGLLGTTFGRPRAACPALGTAIVVLLCLDPWLALSPGFALSALATLGLVLFARPWGTALSARIGERWHRACEMLIVPVAAQALCLPVLVALSGLISLVSIPANILAEPLVAPATLGGLGVLLLAPLWHEAALVLAWLPGLPALGIAWIAHLAADVPFGAVPWGSGPVAVVGIVLVVGAVLFGWRVIPWAGWRGGLCAFAVLLLPAGLFVPVPGEGAAPRGWRYVACDVGQGDGGLVATGPGRAVAVDVGPQDATGILDCLARHRIDRLDAIVLSHYHADHVGALGTVLQRYSTGAVYVTPVTEGADGSRAGERGYKREVDAATRRASITPVALYPGQSLVLGDVVISVVGPRRTIREGSIQNNASLILDVTAPDAHILFLGDAEREAQTALLAEVSSRATQRPYDVVKVAHHGSANQNAALYGAAKARYAVIGVGVNDYGHPTRKALDMVTASGSAPLRTDESGDVTFVSDGSGLAAEPQRG